MEAPVFLIVDRQVDNLELGKLSSVNSKKILILGEWWDFGVPLLLHGGYSGSFAKCLKAFVSSKVDISMQWESMDIRECCGLMGCVCGAAVTGTASKFFDAFCESKARVVIENTAPEIIICFGELASSVAKRSISLSETSVKATKVIDMIHPSAPSYDSFSDVSKEKFWNSFFSCVTNVCKFLENTVAIEEAELYKFCQGCIGGWKVETMEKVLELEKKKQKGKNPASKGTAGFLSTDKGSEGVINDPPRKSTEAAKKDFFIGKATRRLIPAIPAIANGVFTRNLFGPENAKVFGNLVLLRFNVLFEIFQKIRFIGMIGFLLRSVCGIADSKIISFDREKTKTFLLQICGFQEQDFTRRGGFDNEWDIGLKEHDSVIKLLQEVGTREIKDPIKNMKLIEVYRSLFNEQVAVELLTRSDVSAKSQTLQIMRFLLDIWSRGTTNSALLSVLFTFSTTNEFESLKIELETTTEEEDQNKGEEQEKEREKEQEKEREKEKGKEKKKGKEILKEKEEEKSESDDECDVMHDDDVIIDDWIEDEDVLLDLTGEKKLEEEWKENLIEKRSFFGRSKKVWQKLSLTEKDKVIVG